MTFWIIASLMVVGTIGALVLPLLRRRAEGTDTVEYDLEVYRDQLGELQRDNDRGVITDDDMEAARTEIARRMLAADARMAKRGPSNPWFPGIPTSVLLAILTGSLVIGIAANYSGLGWVRRYLWTVLTALVDADTAMSGSIQLAVTITVLVVGLAAALFLLVRIPVRTIAAALAVTMPLGAVLLYLQFGTPGLPGMPLAQRVDLPIADELDQRARQQIAELARAAEANPGDADAWLQLAEAYRSVGRYGEAEAAYRKAVGLGPASTDVYGDFAETLVMAAQGSVTPEARTVFESILTTNPGDPKAHYFLALADYQAGRTREAIDRWSALIAATRADAPWLDIVRENLARAARDLGLDVAEIMPEPLPALGGGAPQLTPEQQAELDAMSPAERDAMIREMVDMLDARLLDEPMNLEGWERLVRARMVLGERDAAQDALGRALEAFAQAPVPTRRLVELAGELRLDIREGDVQAPDIGDMVEGLAARLQEEPDDLKGWLMLARSYTVLGEPEKAREAMASAAGVAPDNPDVLILHARAVRDANGGLDNDEAVAILRRVLDLAPNHPEALWYVANAEAGAGNKATAREMLERLLSVVPKDSPDRELILRQIEELAG